MDPVIVAFCVGLALASGFIVFWCFMLTSRFPWQVPGATYGWRGIGAICALAALLSVLTADFTGMNRCCGYQQDWIMPWAIFGLFCATALMLALTVALLRLAIRDKG